MSTRIDLPASPLTEFHRFSKAVEERRDMLTWQFPESTADMVRTALLNDGERVTVRGEPTLELSPVVAAYPLGHFPHREGMASRLGLVEGLMLVSGTWDPTAVEWAAPKADMALFGPMARYGPRVRGQLDRAMFLLRQDSTTRRAVVTLPSRTESAGPNLPCTVSIQLLVRRGELNLVVNMRSWDAAYGMPTDLMAFGVLGMFAAHSLNVAYGRLTVIAGSLHGYDSTLSMVRGGTIGRALLLRSPANWAAAKRLATEALKERHFPWLQLSTRT